MKTKHEKIIRCEDGSRVKIVVNFYIPSYSQAYYDVSVYTCAKRKRTWRGVINGNDYSYRALSMEDRKEYERKKQLEIVTPLEILEAKTELWEKMKPELLEV